MNLESYCEVLLKKLPPGERATLERQVDAQIYAYAGTNPRKRARRLGGIDRTTLLLKAIHVRSLLRLLEKARREGRLKPMAAVANLEGAVARHMGDTETAMLTVAAFRARRRKLPARETNREALERQLLSAGKAKAIAQAQRCRADLYHSLMSLGIPYSQLTSGQDLSADASEIVDALICRLRCYQDALRQMLAVVWWHSEAMPTLEALVSERMIADKLLEHLQEAILDALCQASRPMDFRQQPGLRDRLVGVSMAITYLQKLHYQWLQQLDE